MTQLKSPDSPPPTQAFLYIQYGDTIIVYVGVLGFPASNQVQ